MLSVGTGAAYTCAVLGSGSVECVGGGTGASPLMGNGTNLSSATFVAPTIGTVRRVMSGGINHICALLRDGTVRCWGTNTAGTMGLGTSGESRSTPVLTPF